MQPANDFPDTIVEPDTANRRTLINESGADLADYTPLDAQYGMPLVTVAITACERPLLFDEAFKSVLRQTHSALEIVVLDNSNSDAIYNIVQEVNDSRVCYLRNETAVRDSVVINHRKAFTARRGKYHIVLSSDCVIRDDAIAAMVERLEGDSSVVAVVCNWVKQELTTGKCSPPKAKLKDLATQDEFGRMYVEARRYLERVFESLHGPSAYHTLLLTEIVRSGLIEPVYYSQAYEHHSGLDLALCKSRIAVIDDTLIYMIQNSERFSASSFRQSPLFNKAVARAKFLDRKYPDLVSQGYNVQHFQFVLAKRFFQAAARERERRIEALMFGVTYLAPIVAAVMLMPFFILADGLANIARYYKANRAKHSSTRR